MASKATDNVVTTSSEEGRASNSGPTFVLTDAAREKWQAQEKMRREHLAELQRLKEQLPDPEVTLFNPRPFGATGPEILPDPFRDSVVSIGLFHGEMMIFACSGTAVQCRNGMIQGCHSVFVTTVNLALEFESKRKRDDNFSVRVRVPDGDIIYGFLGLFDRTANIAIITAFNTSYVYHVDTSVPVDLLQDTDARTLVAAGHAFDGTLMRSECSDVVFRDGIMSCRCDITEAGLGGPVMLLDGDGNGHFAGVITTLSADGFAFLPTESLYERLQHFQISSKTNIFHGYSLPKDVECVVPAGFKLSSNSLKSWGYSLPPPLMFEPNGRIVCTFEERFGELHAWEGYPFDVKKPISQSIWDQLGKEVVQRVSKSVVSIASYKRQNDKDTVRFFACTGLLITRGGREFVLTSANLVRTSDVEGDIDLDLQIEVFLPPKQLVEGTLELCHQDYNIAVISLKDDLTDVCPLDIFVVTMPSKSKEVAAIGRRTREMNGLLMASRGNLKYRRKCAKRKRSKRNKNRGLILGCKDLRPSSCRIQKVGIGGPLIRIEDGSFIGMNFYDESGTTLYLPRSNIAEVLRRGFTLLDIGLDNGPIILDRDKKGNAAKRNRWPVPKPYWCLDGYGDVLDQLRGRVLM